MLKFISSPLSIINYFTFLGIFLHLLIPQYSLMSGSVFNTARAFNEEMLFYPALEAPYTLMMSLEEDNFSIVQSSSLMPSRPLMGASGDFSIKEGSFVWVTAYSSTPDQTDDTPFITASGQWVRDGIVASNFLEFGTKVMFPGLFGDKVFVVEDRMALKNSHKVDIWFPSRWQALNFGVKYTPMIVL